MNAQYTQGPWCLAGTTVYSLTPYTGSNDRCRAYLKDGINRFSARVSADNSESSGGASHAELVANARLIAAAPELLEALQELLPHAFEYWSEYGGNDDYIARARAAIAKASPPPVHET